MQDPEIESLRYDHPPGIVPSYLRALVRRGGLRPLPLVEAVLPDVRIDRRELEAYNRVCGFPIGADTLPPTYPHILAFPAALALMTRRDFPVAPLGMVHIGNRITVHRPIDADERLTLRVRPDDLRPHPRGTAFDMITSAYGSASAVLAWESRSTFLRRHAEPGSARTDSAPEPPLSENELERWRLPSDIGRKYAAVSGDRNPIHLYPWTARLFGFKRAIAHGMCTKARVLAALGSRLPPVFEVDVSFRTPVLLPATVRLIESESGDFAVVSADGSRTHLRGTVAAGS